MHLVTPQQCACSHMPCFVLLLACVCTVASAYEPIADKPAQQQPATGSPRKLLQAPQTIATAGSTDNPAPKILWGGYVVSPNWNAKMGQTAAGGDMMERRFASMGSK